MSYESDCNDYALYGDPMRDHYDYEENAQYDRFDGWGDPDPCYEYDLCPECHTEDGAPDCETCAEAAAEADRLDAECAAERNDYDDDDVPF